jgi:protein O-GlcNAc transferase
VQAIAAYEECSHLCPENANAAQNRLLALNYIYPGESALVCDAHAVWGKSFQAAITPLPAIDPQEWPQASDGRLRVGYISPDLHRHSVSYFAEAPLLLHDRSAVEVRCCCCAALCCLIPTHKGLQITAC